MVGIPSLAAAPDGPETRPLDLGQCRLDDLPALAAGFSFKP